MPFSDKSKQGDDDDDDHNTTIHHGYTMMKCNYVHSSRAWEAIHRPEKEQTKNCERGLTKHIGTTNVF
jgi:hypothetical protein